MTWLLIAFRFAGKAAGRVLGLVWRYPLQAALIASLAFSAWQWREKNEALADLAECQADRISFETQAEAARRLAEMAKAKAEAHYRQQAEEADHAHAEALADARSAADRYIAAHRLRPETAGGPSGRAPAPAESGSAGVPPDLPADPVVLGADDVRACAAWVGYGIAARRWALGL